MIQVVIPYKKGQGKVQKIALSLCSSISDGSYALK